MAVTAKTDVPLQYKGFPLMRKENILYYGSMSDSHIIMMQILDNKTEDGLDMSSRVSVQLQQTSSNPRARQRVVKSTEKSSLWGAMDVASIWLRRALSAK